MNKTQNKKKVTFVYRTQIFSLYSVKEFALKSIG